MMLAGNFRDAKPFVVPYFQKLQSDRQSQRAKKKKRPGEQMEKAQAIVHEPGVNAFGSTFSNVMP